MPLNLTISESATPADLHPAAHTHSMLGMGALLAELQAQGVPSRAVLEGSGLTEQHFGDQQVRMSHAQKVTLYRNALRLAGTGDVGLRAGQRQRLCDFGVYGYALVSSPTFGDAVALGVRHIKLAGPVLEKRFRIEGDTAIFEGRDVLQLGELLPLCTEYWFSSIHRLTACVLEAPLPSRVLMLPYARPAHAEAYEAIFDCPVQFGAGRLEWHFDASMLQFPLPHAQPRTAELCEQMCQRLAHGLPAQTELELSIRTACIESCGSFPKLDEMACQLGLSVRTLQRRLSELGSHYQQIMDDLRSSLAIEFLTHTTLSVDEVGQRLGFSEATNFRKAFRKWTGQSPGTFRGAIQLVTSGAGALHAAPSAGQGAALLA